MEKNKKILEQIKGGLIVSCQALPQEPLYDSYIMSKMAYAAMLGGAVGIRANTVVDILAIRERVDLPIIGIIKHEYDDSDVYITPTIDEVDALVEIGCDIIATDATKRIRPYGKNFEEFFHEVRAKYPNQLFMADTSCFEEGQLAERLGFDLIGTTMAGYTPYTKGRSLPDLELIEKYSKELNVPIIAEGGIWSPDDLKNVYKAGAFSAVCGTAITRPMDITKRFVKALDEYL
ncbi:N-acetylmannosamine-6-phosphate 2-epimerase [uncultured Eubacterium sp.]|uniref:N-acetylmannosamine-6-phosphate 2-epimerase n=1 Tax=uncultured Eubacterium sp. TaxID=165185 RepID=UPI0015C03EC5|nr:N-acetylmannosamine-6-phosphate 2-epimerase [uncultured Eubacterium sp.]